LWSNPKEAEKVMRERTRLESALGTIRRLRAAIDDNAGLIEMAEAEKDEATIAECEKSLREAGAEARKARLETLLAGEADPNNAFVEINAGAGGTESQDWAEMLARMYTRWAEQHGYRVLWLEESAGEEAGIKSCAFKVEGPNAYGWLKTEAGVHRLVRISPFDGNARRHTSFASAWVYPEVDDNIEIEILDKDLRVDTYRASGAGGQHVNKTDSAVRITHIPTGIAVAVQQERSQHQNRAKAMQMLKGRLYELELEKREAERLAAEATKTDIGWGHQIRSYVLQPYQMVKDLRTGVERSDPQKVLDGDLDEFMAASLAARVGEGADTKAEH
jgi:peptide chain release factor 2